MIRIKMDQIKVKKKISTNDKIWPNKKYYYKNRYLLLIFLG